MSVNAAQFRRELDAEADKLFRQEVPRAVAQIALELRQSAEDHTHQGATGRRKASWMAGRTVESWKARQSGSDADARAALAGLQIGEPVFIYSTDFVSWFLEFGTVHHRPFPALQPALQKVASREIRL